MTRINNVTLYLIKIPLAQRGKSNFAFYFLKCAVEDNEVLSKIWKYYRDGVNYKQVATLHQEIQCCRINNLYQNTIYKKDPYIYIFAQYLQFAFGMCAAFGGFLPTFASKDEFEALFHAFRELGKNIGGSEIILWGEVDKVGDELFWCRGGAKLPLQPVVNGTTDHPFFLVSLAGPTPNLNAIQLNRTDVNTTIVYCLHSKEYIDECSSGKRANGSSSLEDLLNLHG